MDVSWFKDIYKAVNVLLTPTMLGKVLSKKITDAEQFCKEFIKSKPWLKNSDVTPQKLEEYLVYNYSNPYSPSLGSLIQPLSVAESGRVLLDLVINNMYNDHYKFHQPTLLALALDKKIDFSMSISDMDELLIQLDKQMMKVKLENYADINLFKSQGQLVLSSPAHIIDATVSQEPLLDLVMQDL